MPPSRGWRALAWLATAIAGALLIFVAVHWIWKIVGPAPVHIAPATPDDPTGVLIASGLFGRSASNTAGETAASALGSDVRLLGVFAESGDRGYALFRLSSGPKLVASGQEIAPGATLTAVRNDSVVVRDAGVERTMLLRGGQPKAAATAPLTTANARTLPPKSACAPPANFKGQIVALNTELMSGLIAQPDSWRALLEPAGGALVVRDESGFASMLGLRRGDRIEQANGIALSSADDVIGAVLRPLASNQPVRVTGSRDGQHRELWLRNANC